MNRRHDIYAELHNFGRYIGLHISMAYGPESKIIHVAQPLTYVDVDRDRMETGEQPAIQLTMADAQQLIDQLWKCGMRPSEGGSSAGALAATELHLADMQKIVDVLLPAVIRP